MSISYEEALATLQSMFGDSWTREDLDTVLRHQKGHMENTVDMILRNIDKDPSKLVEKIQNGIDPEAEAQSMDEQLARQLAQGEQAAAQRAASGGGGGGSSTAATSSAPAPPRGRGKPTTLPDDFLRIPGYQRPAGSASSTSAGAAVGGSVMDDETLARMLQDELFSEELARNPQFAHLARGGVGRPRTAGGMPVQGRNVNSNNRAAAASNAQQRPSFNLQPLQHQGEQIMEKISTLGDNARRRLQLMAAQFNAKNANAGGTPGGAGGVAGQDSRVAASERRGLLDDDVDDMELAARKDL